MGDNFRVELIEALPARGRRHAKLRCRVVQSHPDACHLRALKHDVSGRSTRLAGRLLADAPVPAFATAEPWQDSARFAFIAKSQGVTFVEVVSHDLIALLDRDHAALAELAKRADWPELDVDAHRELYGEEPEITVADEPDHYANFVDEAVIEVRLSIPLPPECTIGLAWGTSAFA